MGQITINRISGYSNKLREIKLVLDNEVLGTIKDGESKSFEINPGKHKLKATIDWAGSNEMEFEMSQNENRKFDLKGTKPFLAIYYSIFARKKYLILEDSK